MAISIVNTITGTDTDGNSTASTASVTPSANKLQLLSVNARTNISVDTNTPTATGNGLTWVQINTILYDTTSASRKRLTLFRAMGSSPTTGAISIDFGGQNQTDIHWTLDEVTGMDTSGTNGSGAIVQSATAKDETATASSLTVTLGAFSDTNNATYGSITDDGSSRTPSVGSGFTALGTISAVNINSITEYKTTNDTTVDASFSGTANGLLGGIAVEIKIAPAAVTVKTLAALGVG